MNEKITSILEKALQDKKKGNYKKALRRLSDGLEKSPNEIELYLEAADVCIESGEPLQGTHYLKKAGVRVPAEKKRIDSYAVEKVQSSGDPVLAKFLIEQMIKKRDLDGASDVLDNIQDRTVRELLQRNRTKKQTLESAARTGHTLKGELVTNLMSEALFCLRLGRMKESIRSFMSILDDKPAENETFEPFFASLEKKHPKSGRIRYAYACSLFASRQYEKAISRLVQSVKLEPKMADDVRDKLRAVSETFETPPESVQDALVAILLEKGDTLRASEILQKLLSDQPESARNVRKLLQPYVENDSDSLLLHHLYMDAALLAEQPHYVAKTLGEIRQNDAHRDDIFNWLEDKSKETFLPADIMIVHGEIAIEVGKTDRGLEIFQAIAANSPNDIPVLLTVVEKHKNTDKRFEDFLTEHSTAQQTAAAGGLELERFENSQFGFSNGSGPEPAGETANPDLSEESSADESSASTPDPEETPDESNTGLFDTEFVTPEATDSHIAQNDLSPLEKELEKTARNIAKGGSSDIIWEEDDTIETFAPSVKYEEASPEKWDDSVAATSHEHEENIGGTIELTAEPPGELPGEPAEEIPDPFDESFSLFLDGDMDNESILSLVDEALAREMFDEAKELLHFEPVNDEETLARKLSLICYYMAIERPSSALGIIETIKLISLDPDSRRNILIKKAACQKSINDFEGALKTYRRLAREFPSPEIERMAKRNYERYLQSQCGEDLVLEKITSIRGY